MMFIPLFLCESRISFKGESVKLNIAGRQSEPLVTLDSSGRSASLSWCERERLKKWEPSAKINIDKLPAIMKMLRG
jgi:hypothetical protein